MAGARSPGVVPVREWDLLSARQREKLVDGTLDHLGWFRNEIPDAVLQQIQPDDLYQYFGGARWIENDAVRKKVDEIARRSKVRFTPPVRPLEYEPHPHRAGGPATPTIPPTLGERLHLTHPAAATEEPGADEEPAAWDESVPDPVEVDEEPEPAPAPPVSDDPLAQLDALEGIESTNEPEPSAEPLLEADPEETTAPAEEIAPSETDVPEPVSAEPLLEEGSNEPPPPLEEDPADLMEGGTDVDSEEITPQRRAEAQDLIDALDLAGPLPDRLSEDGEAADVETDLDDYEPAGADVEPEPTDASQLPEPEPAPAVRVLNPTENELSAPLPDTVWVSLFMGGIGVMLLACWNLAGFPTIPFVTIGWAFAGLILVAISVAVFAVTTLGQPTGPAPYVVGPAGRPVRITVEVK